MSVALHGLVDHLEPEVPTAQPGGRRWVVVSAALATLAAIAGPLLAAGIGSLVVPEPDLTGALTPVARQVLEQEPGAYQTGDMVVVPADQGTVWTNDVPRDRVDGAVVDLGVRGLVQPGYLAHRGTRPDWMSSIGDRDRVFTEVGDLSFACTRWPGADTCTGSLLTQHDGNHFIVRSGLSLEVPEQVNTFPALDLGLPTDLALGVMPQGAVSASVSVAGDGWQNRMLANTSPTGAVGGATLWWVSVPAHVESVTFLDGHNQVIGTAR